MVEVNTRLVAFIEDAAKGKVATIPDAATVTSRPIIDASTTVGAQAETERDQLRAALQAAETALQAAETERYQLQAIVAGTRLDALNAKANAQRAAHYSLMTSIAAQKQAATDDEKAARIGAARVMGELVLATKVLHARGLAEQRERSQGIESVGIVAGSAQQYNLEVCTSSQQSACACITYLPPPPAVSATCWYMSMGPSQPWVRALVPPRHATPRVLHTCIVLQRLV